MFRRWWYRRIRKALLFSFWDGERIRSVDGERLWRAIANHPILTDPLFQVEAAKDQPEKVDQYLDAVAEVFGVQRYDPSSGKGLTDGELANTIVAFSEWLRQKKTPRKSWLMRWLTSVLRL